MPNETKIEMKNDMKKAVRRIVMLGTGFETRGGISSVVNVYREAGLFERFPITYVTTHVDGSALAKMRVCVIAWLRYMGLLIGGKVALAHVHISTGISFWRKLLFVCPALVLGVPAVLHLHGADFAEFYDEGSKRRKWILRTVFDKCAGIIVLSHSWKEWVRSVSGNPVIIPIYNPVALPRAVDFWRRSRDGAGILLLGQLGKRKGIYDLLEAVARLVDKHPRLKLVLAGDGEAERVKTAAKRLGLHEHVDVLDWVAGREKSALLESAAVYALPSYCEGLPMSVLEAMAAGLPVVCTPVGGVPEAVTDGREGWVIAPGDVDALAGALDKLLSDAGLRRRMGDAGRRKVENTFSVTKVVPQLERLYEKLGAQRLGVRPCLP
jgi:glycosyltransferase involved in cell wall biosynthesis